MPDQDTQTTTDLTDTLPPQHQAPPGSDELKHDPGDGVLKQGLDAAPGETVEAQLDAATPTLTAEEVRDRLEQSSVRPMMRLGRPVVYRVPVPLHRPALTEPGVVVKVHPVEDGEEDQLLVDLQVFYSEGQNGSRLVTNVKYDPDGEAVGTWSLPY